MTKKYQILILIITLTSTLMHGQELPSVCAESTEKYGVSGYNNSEFIWSVEGGNIISGDGTNQIEIQWGYNTGEYRVEVLEITKQGCTNVPSDTTIKVVAPYVDLGWDYYEICDGDSLVLDAYIEYDTSYKYKWFNDIENTTRYVAKESELIWIRVDSDDGCYRYDTLELSKHGLPVVNLGPDTAICNITENYTIDLGSGGAEYLWSSTQYNYNNEQTNNVITAELLPDTIIARVIDFNGCENSDTAIILPCDISELFAKVTNTITPDGDGNNDVWNIKYINLFPNAVLEIFDRQGRLVYRTENPYEEPWDGTSKGRALPMDSYYFVIELNFLGAQPIVGTVNIIK